MGVDLERVGLWRLRFKTHLFQIGAASTAASLEYSPEEVKRVGRWSSNHYRLYVRSMPQL